MAVIAVTCSQALKQLNSIGMFVNSPTSMRKVKEQSHKLVCGQAAMSVVEGER